MNGLFEKIYDEVICYEKDVTAMNQAIEHIVSSLFSTIF